MKYINLIFVIMLIASAADAAPLIGPNQINWTQNINSQIHDIVNGTAAQDAATYSQVQALISGGDFDGPASSTANNFVSFLDTTGKTGKDSGYAAASFAASSHTHSYLPLAGGTMSGVLAMGSQKITGLASGTASGDAATFGQTWMKLNKSSDTLGSNLAAGGYKITGLAAGSTNGDSVRYEQLAGYLPLTGGTMTGAGPIAMATQKITGMGNGTTAQDAVTYSQLHTPLSATTSGIVTAAGSSTGKYLKDNGAWDTPSGAGSYLPLSGGTMAGNIAMGGYKVTGAANGTASGDYVTYSQMRETGSGFVFRGHTGAELHAFVDSHGPGIYYLPETVVCNSQFVYDQPRVMFIGSSGPTNWLDAGATTYSGTFDFTGMADSTVCMSITASNPYFLGCQFESDGANQVLVEVSYTEVWGSHPTFIDCGFSQKDGSIGTCLKLYTHADNYQVIRCTFAVGSGGKGIQINGAGGGIINSGMIGGGGAGSIGLHVIKGAPRLTDVYLMDQATSIYLDPQNDYDVETLLLTSVIADYADGGAGSGAIVCSGSHKVRNIWATNVDLWAANGRGMYLSNVDMIYWTGGTIGGTGSGYEGIYIDTNSQYLFFTGVQIMAGSTNTHAINMANSATIKNIRFMNCDIWVQSSGYGISVPDNVDYVDLAHNSVNSITMTAGTYKTNVGNMPHG